MLPELFAAVFDQPLAHTRPLSGGQIGEVYLLEGTEGGRAVAKVDPSPHAVLDVEAYMLTYLAEQSALPVPAVWHSTPNLLLMSYISGQSHFSPTAEAHAADLLAQLHDITAPHYGLERDTLIGRFVQPNTTHTSWIDFFREERLLHRGRAALEDGLLPAPLFARLEGFCGQLEQWLVEPARPSLIHGDIWANNVLAEHGRVTGFIDPAIYYADAEMELAYIALFHTFGATFFERYQAHRPLDSGFFEVRRHIYALYPLLVHVHHFGGDYVSQVAQVLAQFDA
jgi:fructosamine-3-kinase